MNPETPTGIPLKFSPTGTIQPFPGNTIVCHLPPSSPLRPGLLSFLSLLEFHPLSSSLAFLPESSWHMTLAEGVCDLVRKPEVWPPSLIDSSLEICTAEFAAKLRALGKGLEDEGLGPPYGMRVKGVRRSRAAVEVWVEGRTGEEDGRVRRLRGRLAEGMGVEREVERFGFHVSVAYLLKAWGEEEWGVVEGMVERLVGGKAFELGAGEFCTFEDVAEFKRVFYLGEGGQ